MPRLVNNDPTEPTLQLSQKIIGRLQSELVGNQSSEQSEEITDVNEAGENKIKSQSRVDHVDTRCEEHRL